MNTQYKYRPRSLDEFVFPTDQVERKIRKIATGSITRPLVLHGSFGTGKSTLATLIPHAIEGTKVKIDRINAEDLNNSAEVRKSFYRDRQFDNLFAPEGQSRHYTVVEEVNFDPKAKGALRNTLDVMEGRDLVIFTTNALEKLDDGLLSRAEVIEIPPATAVRFLPRALEILRAEGIDVDDNSTLEVLESVYDIYRDNRAYFKALDEIIAETRFN